MTKPPQLLLSMLRGLQRTVLPLAISCGLPVLALRPAQAQTFSILHTFMGAEGCNPIAGPTLDRSGNLYGTTSGCGGGAGTAFKLTHAGTGWVLSTLFGFTGGSDGAGPRARMVFGPDGALYGTTSAQSMLPQYGTVFRLRPSTSPCHSVSCPWTETVLYLFTDADAGRQPGYGDLAFDAAGNIYGATVVGGENGAGTVYKLTHSNGGWTESVLYSFSTSDLGGYYPYGGAILDSAGNVYGTAEVGGIYGGGVLFKLTQSGSSWTETVLSTFGLSGYFPFARPIMDGQGNLYGTTSQGPGGQGGGTVYELHPSGGAWIHSVLAALPALPGTVGPLDALTMDAAGNLYGTTQQGGSNGYGSVFKLTRSGDNWTYTDLHDFNNQDGANPYGSVALDAQGNIYGTTFSGGGAGHGEVWMITP